MPDQEKPGRYKFCTGYPRPVNTESWLGRGGGELWGPVCPSLDSTVTVFSGPTPWWEILSAHGTSPSGAVEREDLFKKLMKELAHLKVEHWEVITLAFFDQLPTAEIAARMDLSRPAASMLLIHAIRGLRRQLTGSSRP